jgi:hypothetical protein
LLLIQQFLDGFTRVVYIIKMIETINEYDYLGNGLEKINSNWKELNIRLDNLYSSTPKWNSFATTFRNLSANLQSVQTLVQTASSDWRRASSLVFNVKNFWQEPVLICYKKTFNCISNWLEIQTWLNSNFPASNFVEEQNIICEYLCTNYAIESIEGTFTPQYNEKLLNSLALNYSTTAKNVFLFLGFENQMNALVKCFNLLLHKYNKTDLLIENYSDIATFNITGLVYFDINSNSFVSEELSNFNQTDLIFFHSYCKQYEIIYKNYSTYAKGIEGIIPRNILNQFVPLNLNINNAGQFIFKNVNGQWTYREYTGLNFCALDVCSDCYDYIDPNSLYKDKDCFRYKYILTECEYYDPELDL